MPKLMHLGRILFLDLFEVFWDFIFGLLDHQKSPKYLYYKSIKTCKNT
jgi:hypothetical protein